MIEIKGFGCAICPVDSYSYFQKVGSTKFGITSEDFKQSGMMMFTKCQKRNVDEALPSYAVGNHFFHTYLEEDSGSLGTYQEKPCYEKYSNCMICGGNPGNKCQICLDGHYLLNSTDEFGNTETICVNNCPTGFRNVVSFNGYFHCEPCVISNCQTCNNIKL